MKPFKTRVVIVAASLLAASGAVFGVVAASNPAGASTRPALPDLSKRTQMVLLGNSGKPILGKTGKPIKLTVGGPPAPPPRPPILQRPLTQAEVEQAATAGPVTITIPKETDQQKAQRLAPDQAP
jgi:hypothetical protein